jgi:predicted Zn-dependent peptidase
MYEMTTLANDLRILTVRLPHVQSVSLAFLLDVGSRYESEPLAGASHFIEHMVFKGTERRPTPLEIAEAIEGKGGILGASTGLETTLYWAKLASAHLPEALDVVSDMLLHPRFAASDMEKERAIIGEEISSIFDAPEGLSQFLVNQLQWPQHPLGRDVAGTKQSVAALTRAALLDYMAEHYRPGRVILGLAGQVEHEKVVTWAQSNLSGWEPGAPAKWAPAPVSAGGPKLQVRFRETEQAHLSFSFAALSRGNPDRFALQLLNVILGEGMQSRLFQRVREELGLAYSIGSFVSRLQDTGAMGIFAGVGPGRTEEAIRAILDELDRLRQQPIPESELVKTVEFVKGRMALSMEDSFTVAAWFAQQQLLGPEVLEPSEAVSRFEAVQASDVQRLAGEIFQKDKLNLAIVGPFSQNGDRFQRAIRF